MVIERMLMKRLFCLAFVLLFSVSTSFAAKGRLSSEKVIISLERGREQYELGNYDWALKYYTDALKLDSSNPRTHFALASAHLAQGDYQLAIDYYEEAVELNPALIEAYYGLSCAYQALDKPEKAMRFYRKALGLDLQHRHRTLNSIVLTSTGSENY